MASPTVGSGVRPSGRSPGRQGSEEYHSATLPPTQEAALLHAANFVDAAVQLLKAEIKDPVGRGNKQAWLMLFDLFQATHNRQEFDSLSMLFSVKFEQSAPAWSESAEAAADPRRNLGPRERKDFFALKPAPTGELAAEIEKLAPFAESQGTLRLDVAKVTAITPEEATLLALTLKGLRRKAIPMWFNNTEGLEQVLRTAFNEKATQAQRPYWALLFELYILLGKAQEFEDLGLEFAIAFEMSPPNWETYVNSVAATAKASASAKAPPPPPAEGGVALKGVISAASANQVAELNGYASNRTEVAVDMSKVMRVEFNFIANFFEAIRVLQAAGKRVIITNLNELNAGLLEALGINRFAILVRRKST